MLAVRRLLAQRRFAGLICGAMLMLKLLVPTGYMVANDHGHVTIMVCTGVASDTMAMPGMHGAMTDHGKKDSGKTEMPCAFAGLSAQALGAVDPLLLLAVIAFIMAIGRRPAVLRAPIRQTHLRPPLRGPPITL